jgi:glycosyltransferase involved in cell wall biosynthesis
MRDGIVLVAALHPKKRGSLEEQLLALARALHDVGVPLTYVFSGPPAPFLGDELRALGVSVRLLDFARPVPAATQLSRWLQQSPPLLVHFHFVRAYSPLVAAARLSGAKVALHEHIALEASSPLLVLRLPAKRARSAALNWMVQRRIAVSPFVARTVREVDHVPAGRVAVVENGIDLRRFEQQDGASVRRELGASDAPLVCCVARLDAEKGVESAVRSLALLPPPAQLLIVGEGPLEPRLRALAGELGALPRLRLLGLRNDVERVLAASTAVIAPSHWEEAFGLAVVEAMAAARPVVVSDSGAMPGIVGPAGLVVPKRDPEALARALLRLIGDPLLRARLGRAGRRRARERYGMARWLASLLSQYAELCPELDLPRLAA